MTKHIVYTNLAQAEMMQATIDAALGYPKDGFDYNGGIHDQSEITAHYIDLRPHPTEQKWAILVDDTVRTFMTNGETEETLGNDWVIPRPS